MTNVIDHPRKASRLDAAKRNIVRPVRAENDLEQRISKLSDRDWMGLCNAA